MELLLSPTNPASNLTDAIKKLHATLTYCSVKQGQCLSQHHTVFPFYRSENYYGDLDVKTLKKAQNQNPKKGGKSGSSSSDDS